MATRLLIDHRTTRHPEKGQPAGQPDPAEAGLDPGEGAESSRVSPDAGAHARERARDGVRGGGLPEHRGVLVAAACDDDDHGGHVHPRVFVLQRSDPGCRRRWTRRSRGGWRMRWRGLGCWHVVITSVDRDDLADGGAAHFGAVIRAIRAAAAETTIEVLTPDFLRKPGAMEVVAAARPDVFNHNLETVPRLYPTIRPGARYYQSLRLLDQVKQADPGDFHQVRADGGSGGDAGGDPPGDGVTCGSRTSIS